MTNDDSICVLLAVWGERYIQDFLSLGLPSLLAPGNLPILANHYPVRFVFLTRTTDIPLFNHHPAVQKLSAYCVIEFIPLDDLITLENYSTTLTLALDRAIKSTGKHMLKTYFLILMADYILADGSLRGLIRYLQAGYSGICAGNFQILKEDTKAFFLNKVDKDNHILKINPRDLLAYSFGHLHPVTLASIYNQGMLHNYQANRFLYRYNSEIMVGRFYLLHALCIRPEVETYQVGSSFDYSFIPEMCPSGKIAVINDSDDYLVVEIQPKKHELLNVVYGNYHPKKLALALSEWTTKQHRENAKVSIYFHTRDVLPEEKSVIESETTLFINKLTDKLKNYKEQPYYNHPYWCGAIEGFNAQRQLIHNDKDLFNVAPATEIFSLPRKLYYRFSGVPPKIFPWHYRWREYHLLMKIFKDQITSQKIDDTIAFYSHYNLEVMPYYRFFKEKFNISIHYHLEKIINYPDKMKELKNRKFQNCILLVSLENLLNIKSWLSLIETCLKARGKIFILIINEVNPLIQSGDNFPLECAYRMSSIFNLRYRIINTFAIYNNLAYLKRYIVKIVNYLFGYSKKLKFLCYGLLGLPGSIVSILVNIMTIFTKIKFGYCTNVVIVLEQEEEKNDGY